MGCTFLRRPPGTQVPGAPGQIGVDGAPTVTTYQNNDGSYVYGATQLQSSAVHHVPSIYPGSPIRPGENTNNQFLSNDILGAQSKIIPPQPPSYSPTAPPSQPAVYSQGTMSPNIMTQPPPTYSTTVSNASPVGGSSSFSLPCGPSTQEKW